MMQARIILMVVAAAMSIASLGGALDGQTLERAAPLNSSGRVMVAGRLTPFLIRHLPVSSFPQLPESVAGALNQRGCMIPQTYEAHRPENVVHASLERAGSSDWAVLCSVEGKVSLLVFFDGGSGQDAAAPVVLASTEETDRLQAQPGSGVLGFNWGIDGASPEQVHEAQSGLAQRPGRVDHDALADAVLEGRTVYRFYAKNVWQALEMPD
jgi:hypothetical protein